MRLDGGTAYSGALITPYYDSLLVKVTAWAPNAAEAIRRMDRALREFRVRGIATNLQFLENVINHPTFQNGQCTTRFIDQTPELFHFVKRRDRATRLLRFIGQAIVNGNPEVQGRAFAGAHRADSATATALKHARAAGGYAHTARSARCRWACAVDARTAAGVDY